MRTSRWILSGCAGLIVAVASFPAVAHAATSTPTPPRVETITIPAPDNEIPSQWLGYPGPPRADVLLPAGYDPSRRYPLLVLLGGLDNDYASYVQTGATALLDRLDAIVVMPEGGDGWYTDWFDDGQRNGPDWETYELDQVLPTILADYPILPQRRDHAIAGVSMGGLGAVYLGGRLPGFFGSVATLSGFVDPDWLEPLTAPAMGLVSNAANNGAAGIDPVAGPPGGYYYDGHNPVDLTANLADTRVFESTGTGVPSAAGLTAIGQGDLSAILVGSLAEGPVIDPMNQLYHAALSAAGVDVTYQVHPGGHDIPDFETEITAMLDWGLFKAVPTDPTSWTNRTVASSGQLWGISYRFAQAPDAVVRFQRSGTTLTLSAAGSPVTLSSADGCSATVPTPASLTLTASGQLAGGGPVSCG